MRKVLFFQRNISQNLNNEFITWMSALLLITVAIIFEIFFLNTKRVLIQMPSTFVGGGNTTIPINQTTVMQNLNIFPILICFVCFVLKYASNLVIVALLVGTLHFFCLNISLPYILGLKRRLTYNQKFGLFCLYPPFLYFTLLVS